MDILNSQIDERTRFEMYYEPFQGAIEANVSSIMCSKNKINGNFTCADDQILKKELKHDLGFSGFVMSDWTGA